VRESLAALRSRGTPDLAGALVFDEFTSLIGLPELQRLEDRYTAS
jgi:hypothetical protein